MERKIKKRLVFGIVLLMAAIVFAVAMTMDISADGTESPAVQGNTLITESSTGRVFEVDSDGNEVWKMEGLLNPQDAERLENGNTLITEYRTIEDFEKGRVIEVDNDGNIYVVKDGLYHPVDAERLENGKTLITEDFEGRVIEVDSSGNIVWQVTGLNFPQDAERLENDITLITETGNGRVIEVDSSGNIDVVKDGLFLPWDAERLANGNTLIVETFGYRVIEVDGSGDTVWEKTGLAFPYDAERLANGNTLITEYLGSQVIEVDSSGDIVVWSGLGSGLGFPWDAERFVPPIEANIDIKPFSRRNIIILRKWGIISVAILSTEDFDATNDIDMSSLTFGKTGDEDSLAYYHRWWHWDVNHDGLRDQTCYFWTGKASFEVGDTEGFLKGMTNDGVPIEGSDSVKIVKWWCWWCWW